MKNPRRVPECRIKRTGNDGDVIFFGADKKEDRLGILPAPGFSIVAAASSARRPALFTEGWKALFWVID